MTYDLVFRLAGSMSLALFKTEEGLTFAYGQDFTDREGAPCSSAPIEYRDQDRLAALAKREGLTVGRTYYGSGKPEVIDY